MVTASFKITPETLEAIRTAAFFEKTTQSELLDRAIRRELSRMERKRGKPYPRRRT